MLVVAETLAVLVVAEMRVAEEVISADGEVEAVAAGFPAWAVAPRRATPVPAAAPVVQT